jgi:hypothetical protein
MYNDVQKRAHGESKQRDENVERGSHARPRTLANDTYVKRKRLRDITVNTCVHALRVQSRTLAFTNFVSGVGTMN